jgi:hypothetical protein
VGAALNAVKLPMLKWQLDQFSRVPVPTPVRSTSTI